VGSTSDFLLGRGAAAIGRLCRHDGWGWQAGEKQILQPPAQARSGCIAAARIQTAGRGRMGRRWQGDGGLQMSWLLDTNGHDVKPGLSVWVGLISAMVLRNMTGLPIGLKWPNDLRLNGRKLGGILLDRVQQKPEARIVAGLGLNIGSLPEDLPGDVHCNAVALPQGSWPGHWASIPAGRIIQTCDHQLQVYLSRGWHAFSDTFNDLDETRNRRIRLDAGGRELTGVAEGIDETGALLLRDDAGERHQVVAGDVHILKMGD
jgi:BirA family transcriptional regulator, biotin operon repressor / biotin---[acetyl-CoA-carboxylase] ligase